VHSLTLIQYGIRILSQSNKERERNTAIPTGNEEVELSLFADDTILYLKNPEDSVKKLLDMVNTFSKVLKKLKNQHQKSLACLYASNEQTIKEIREKIPVIIASK
jgi:hypothetical protein